jgi:hypothetical protein
MHIATSLQRAPENQTGAAARTIVAILLSIYNGEEYLEAQLDSIVAQTHRDWVLLWRDDGSSDGGRRIMQHFAEAIGHDRCIELTDTQRHVGATRSFLTLLNAAAAYELVSFCDQDDTWHAEKLQRAVDQIETVPATVPALYCARKIVVDAELRPIRESPRFRRAPRFADTLAGNIASGSTMVLNRAAVGWINRLRPPEPSFHDWWCYIGVAAAGGRIIADNMPVMRYRQHGGNAIGMASSILGRACRAWRRGPCAFVQQFDAHVTALERQRHLLPQAARVTLDAIAPATWSGMLAWFAPVSSGGRAGLVPLRLPFGSAPAIARRRPGRPGVSQQGGRTPLHRSAEASGRVGWPSSPTRLSLPHECINAGPATEYNGTAGATCVVRYDEPQFQPALDGVCARVLGYARHPVPSKH